MPYLDRTIDFSPSVNSLYIWTFTRKQPFGAGEKKFPGLFKTDYFGWDFLGFVAIVAGEIYGFIQLKNFGVSYAIILSFIFVDVVFAILSHIPRHSICINKNRLILSTDENLTKALEQRIARAKIWTWVGRLCVIGSSFGKIYASWDLVWFQWNERLIPIFLAYILVGLLHIFVTGYFLSEVIRWIVFSWQKSSFNSNFGKSSFRITKPFTQSMIDFNDNKINKLNEWEYPVGNKHQHSLHFIHSDRHSSSKIPEVRDEALEGEQIEKTVDRYVLETWGVLLDSELLLFVKHQSDAIQQTYLAKNCLKHQLYNILNVPINQQ
jgi:hypothetical protein